MILRDDAPIVPNGDVTTRGPERKVRAGDVLKRKLAGNEEDAAALHDNGLWEACAPPRASDCGSCTVSRREPRRRDIPLYKMGRAAL